MAKKLQDYFPLIQTRREVLDKIRSKEALLVLFESWKEEQQEEFLDFCTGACGIKILYDFFFKEIFNPEYHPGWLEEFLSAILQKRLRIAQILPNDSVRIADECSLLITDIIVELDDGSLANIEIQKIGYAFPGERAACYSADMLLRQYKRVRERRKKRFTYRDMKTVYTIVLFEKSTKEFHALKDRYVHRGKQQFDTGLKISTLQEYVLIPLDIFRESMHNKGIETELDAWLTFVSTDEPDQVIGLLEAYPKFRELYEKLYEMCLNMERVMEMFSKELLELDRNTVQYMIEEQEKELKELRRQAEVWNQAAEEKKLELEEKDAALEEKEAALLEKEAENEKLSKMLLELKAQLEYKE